MDSSGQAGIDLHIHSTASDGTLTPREIVSMARDLKLAAIAITDHDTIDGARDVLAQGVPPSLQFVTGVEISATPFVEGFVRLWTTFKNIRRHRAVFLFLAAYFFYIDGVGTIITMSTAYGRELGFGITMMITVLLVIQIVAFPCTLLYGRMTARYKTRTLLLTGIAVYCVITFLAFLLPLFENSLFGHALRSSERSLPGAADEIGWHGF